MLVAGNSEKVSHGFMQSPLRKELYRLPFHKSTGQLGSMLRQHCQFYADLTQATNTRGWCLEERLLARRALVYTGSSLHYECNVVTPFTSNNLAPPLYRSLRGPPLHNTTVPVPVEDVKMRAAIKDDWYHIVVEYSTRRLYDYTDKLPALQAIAEEIQPLLGSQVRYLAGLWSDSLIEELTWSSPLPEKHPRPKYRAPSWSWAAVEGKIMDGVLGLETEKYWCRILKYDITLASQESPFGEVTGGRLEIEGVLKAAEWKPKTFSGSDGGGNDPEIPIHDIGGGEIGFALPDSADDVPLESSGIFLFPLKDIWGLVVVPTESGCWRRAGRFTVFSSHHERFSKASKQVIVLV